jgi:antitoxin MazE
MRAHIVRIGNSKGLRIPKAVLTQLHLESEVELEVARGALVVRRARCPREGWERAFAKAGPQPMLDRETPTFFDKSDWQW